MTIEDWVASGLASLTGHLDDPPDVSRAAVLARARESLSRFVGAMHPTTSVLDALDALDAAHLLAGRAALNGYVRRGRTSAGGATRMFRTADRWATLTLSRDSDLELVPALLSQQINSVDLSGDRIWPIVEAEAFLSSSTEFADRARLLGLPASILGETKPQLPSVRRRGVGTSAKPADELLVVDMSSLWAGPLCGQLLARAGAQVVKVESSTRPDGARRGNPDFFNWMNSGKLSYTVDFARDSEKVARMLSVADVVIEATRPRTLQRHLLDADHLTAAPGQVWLRITAHSSVGPEADWVGFGDDAAVSGGLVGGTADDPVFCGDAIADPLTGIESARLVAESLAEGGGRLIDISLAHTAANYQALGTMPPESQRQEQRRRRILTQPPFPDLPSAQGPSLGVHHNVVEQLVAARS